MAAPFALEDLDKLKSFIEFVAANPSILNLPQLDFFKKLIEKFGGKVPEGNFEMPAGGKCPFGGDVKSESKSSTPPPTAVPEDDDEEETPEMEAESEESEVELDMEASSFTILEPNVLYLDEKPPKIVKIKKAAAPKTKATKKKELKRTATKTNKKSKISVKKTNIQQEFIVKQEISIIGDHQRDEKHGNMDPNDPLYTPELNVKCELNECENEEKLEHKMETQNEKDDDDGVDNKFDQDYEPDDQGDEDNDDDDDNDDYEMYEGKVKKMELSEDDEDEPLIMLTRSKGRPRKYPIKHEYEDKIKAPRLVQCKFMCKQRCTEKFNEEQRKRMCNYYWNLSKEDRLIFIRKHAKSKRVTRMKRIRTNRRGNNCCYYLKDIKPDDAAGSSKFSADLTRVCRKYFEATLCVTNHYIKKALEGYELEAERDLKQLTDVIKANKENNTQEKKKEIRQILDPETGNLITIDPNEKTKRSKASTSSESKPKKKRERRKPGDPLPEHFPKPIKCALRCIHKCHTKFTEQERKQICDIFWSMDFKRRKDFILASIEIKELETQMTPEFRKTNRPPRAYHTRFFLRTGLHSENKRVCKHFMINTLCTNRTFISNAIEFADKTTGYYTGADRRGQHPSTNRLSEERKQYLMEHIKSYPTWVPNKKSKSRYLHHSLTIKQMFAQYKEQCLKDNQKFVSSHYYYKSFHADFRLLFLANPEPKKGGGFLIKNPNISHYTGQEPGGFWLDGNGEKLDLRLYNPALSMRAIQQPSHAQHHSSISSQDSLLNLNNSSSSVHLSQPLNYASAAASAHQLAHFLDPSLASTSRAISHQSSLARLDLNPNLYDNLPHTSTSSILRML